MTVTLSPLAAPAAAYARHLGGEAAVAALRPSLDDPLALLTGAADGPPRAAPVPLVAAADALLAALAAHGPSGAFADLTGAGLLTERAALAGHRRQGAIAPGGACRLLDTADGGLALNLARPDDWALLPAWLEGDEEIAPGDWAAVQATIRHRPRAPLLEQGRLLGLALAADEISPSPGAWCRRTRLVPARAAMRRAPRVLDLSSLWAGPLCGQLLRRLGADVVKLESPQRPDGARQGPPAFYDRLNHGKRSVALDPRTPAGHARWQALFAAADIVIEASRPRALRQLGFEPEALVRAQGLTWISLSGYGREEPQAQWVAYGDDAGVAGGLSARLRQQTGERLFVGDAIADPLTGLHAALAAWQGWQAGGGELVALALRDVIAQLVHFDWPAAPPLPVAAALPLPDPAPAAARPLGADTAAVLLEWTGAC